MFRQSEANSVILPNIKFSGKFQVEMCLQLVRALKTARRVVNALCLLAIDDCGGPAFGHQL